MNTCISCVGKSRISCEVLQEWYRGFPDSTDSLSTVPALVRFIISAKLSKFPTLIRFFSQKIDQFFHQIQANLVTSISPDWCSFFNSIHDIRKGFTANVLDVLTTFSSHFRCTPNVIIPSDICINSSYKMLPFEICIQNSCKRFICRCSFINVRS